MKQITEIQNKLTDVWSYTELEMSDFSTVGLKKHLSAISEIVNDVLFDLDKLNTCTVCQTEVCDTCLDDMAKEIG
jgi:hypothetical protein|tara:strand:- start:449 stop:673 length:225 start_codon:yes stop_codon:yes gene_type:complete